MSTNSLLPMWVESNILKSTLNLKQANQIKPHLFQ